MKPIILKASEIFALLTFYIDIPRIPPICQNVLSTLKTFKLVEEYGQRYNITEKGRKTVEALTRTELPVEKPVWTHPNFK